MEALSGFTPVKRGVRIGVDVGSVRVGVAASDPSGILASPVETVRRDQRSGTDLDRIVALVAEYEAIEVVVGLPARSPEPRVRQRWQPVSTLPYWPNG